MRSITFIAMLFCMAASTLLLGAIALYEDIDFRLHSQRATMELADPTKKITVPTGGYDVHLIDVRYVSPTANVVVPNKRVGGDVARALAAGGKVPITYFTNNHQHVAYPGDERSSPWGWLALGLGLMATFVYAVKLRRRESTR